MDESLDIVLCKLRAALTDLYGSRLLRIILFGSHARQDARPDSDIDVLIVLSGRVDPGEERARTSESIAAISLERDVVISAQFMPLERLEHELSPFLMNIRREGIAV